MLFKTPSISAQFEAVHPELREALEELDADLRGDGLPELTVTDVGRTTAEQEEIYWRRYHLPNVSEAAARAKARRKFSWHLCGAAVDFRCWQYTPEQRRRIRAWIYRRCPSPLWEFLEHDTGSGVHFHLGRQDFEVRRRYERQNRVSTGAV